MKRLLLIAGIAFGMTTSAAFAQHENMPGHENMPPGDHAKHTKNEDKQKDKKKDGGADKKQPPTSDDQKHEGHEKP
jgi:opacity protein-like surface antigen